MAPTITAQPANQTVTAGQTATFAVAASGTAPLSYQWQKNAAAISGATSASYTTPATTTATADRTYVVVVTELGRQRDEQRRDTYRESGAGAPSITTQPASVTVTAGQTATFTVVASGTAPLSYQWQKNAAAISGATWRATRRLRRRRRTADRSSPWWSTTLPERDEQRRDTYGESGRDAPSITTQPASQSVTAGQTATFTVTASGTAPLTYQWQKNGTAISGGTAASYTTPATTTADNGSTFVVVVTNSAGNATSTAATLTVTPIPRRQRFRSRRRRAGPQYPARLR